MRTDGQPAAGGAPPSGRLGDLADLAEAALGADGPFARALDGFRSRESQLALVRAIAGAVADSTALIGEAGTGTGKTFAYLVPALLSRRRTLISTGTKHLQDQLFRRDVPTVARVLGVSPAIAQLKGRANYVCRHHLARSLSDGRFERREDAALMRRIERFAAVSSTGDRVEVPGVPEDSPIWSRATSTRENCLGQDCDLIESCFVMQARRRALQADIVVINHHLFCADLALRDEGISELLPTTELIVFDEAHHVPDVAVQFFGTAVSTRQLSELAREVQRVGLEDARDAANWTEEALRIEAGVRELRAAAGPPARLDATRTRSLASLVRALRRTRGTLDGLAAVLGGAAERSRDLDRLAARCAGLRDRLGRWLAESGVDGDAADGERGGDAARAAAPAPETELPDGLDVLDEEAGAVLWIDVHAGGVTLHRTPLSVAGVFRRSRETQARAWVFVSATLSVAGRFDYFQERMGLEGVRTILSPSPFDYAARTMLYVPESCPEPAEPDFPDRMLEAIAPLVRRNAGRAFVLCTSLRMVSRIAAGLESALSGEAEPYELIVQGGVPRPEMLRRFHAARRPVLVGSASFWEGVDVVGDQLSLVVIDKLPFAPPDDPVVRARSEALRRSGGDPFRSFQIPEAAMALKQGVGRLIRSESDRGLLVVCDRRLVTRSYGRVIRDSLPPFPLTRRESDALAFLSGEQRAAAG